MNKIKIDDIIINKSQFFPIYEEPFYCVYLNTELIILVNGFFSMNLKAMIYKKEI